MDYKEFYDAIGGNYRISYVERNIGLEIDKEGYKK